MHVQGNGPDGNQKIFLLVFLILTSEDSFLYSFYCVEP